MTREELEELLLEFKQETIELTLVKTSKDWEEHRQRRKKARAAILAEFDRLNAEIKRLEDRLEDAAECIQGEDW